MIITDEKLLRTKCETVKPEEVDELITILEDELRKSGEVGNPGIGLAAIQIGIYKKAAIVRINDKYSVNLINCEITQSFDTFTFDEEGCLSFPGQRMNTKRANEIVVSNNLVYPHSFVARGLFSVAIQHELDHINGILLPDRAIKEIPKQKPNELCLCQSGKKYKRCCYLKG